MKANGKMSGRIPWPRWVATRFPRKRYLSDVAMVPFLSGTGTELVCGCFTPTQYCLLVAGCQAAGSTDKVVKGSRYGQEIRMERRWTSRRRKSAHGKWSPRMCSPSSLLLKKQLLVSLPVAACLNCEKRIAELEVDFAGTQEGRQRTSTTRQVGSYFVVSAAAERGNGGPKAWIHQKHVSKPKHIIIMLSDSRRLVVRLSEKLLSAGSDCVACAYGWSNVGVQESGIIVVGAHAPRIACSEFAALFALVCGCQWHGLVPLRADRLAVHRVRWKMSMEQACAFCLVESLHISLPLTKNQQPSIAFGLLGHCGYSAATS